MTPEGLKRLMRELYIDGEGKLNEEALAYGWDYPPCDNCGHAPKEHGPTAMKCQAYITTDVGIYDLAMQDTPCTCDCYDEPEESRLAHSKEPY